MLNSLESAFQKIQTVKQIGIMSLHRIRKWLGCQRTNTNVVLADKAFFIFKHDSPDVYFQNNEINVSCSSKELSVYFKTAHSLYLKLFFFQCICVCVFSDMEGNDIQFTVWKTHRECVFKRRQTPEDKFSMYVIGCKGINKLITVQPMVASTCYF